MPRAFRSGRQFAAWLGLVPKQHSPGDKARMGGISKTGDLYLRHLLVICATDVARHTGRKTTVVSIWVNRLGSSRHPSCLPSYDGSRDKDIDRSLERGDPAGALLIRGLPRL